MGIGEAAADMLVRRLDSIFLEARLLEVLCCRCSSHICTPVEAAFMARVQEDIPTIRDMMAMATAGMHLAHLAVMVHR